MVPFYDGNAYPAKLLDKHGGSGYAASIDVKKPLSAWYPPTRQLTLILLLLGLGLMMFGVVLILIHLARGGEVIEDEMFLDAKKTPGMAGLGAIVTGITVLGILVFRYFARCKLESGLFVPGFPYEEVGIARISEVKREYGKAVAGGTPRRFTIRWMPDAGKPEVKGFIDTLVRPGKAEIPATEKAEELVKAIEVAMKLRETSNAR